MQYRECRRAYFAHQSELALSYTPELQRTISQKRVFLDYQRKYRPDALKQATPEFES